MKSGKFIFSHAAVFAIGAAVAFVAHRQAPESGSSGGEQTANARVSSRAAGAGSAADAGRPSPSSRRSDDRTSRKSSSSGSPAERLAEISRVGNPLERQAALMDLIRRSSPEDFAALAEQYRALNHYGNSSGEFELILRGWAGADPVAALEYTRQRNSREQTDLVLSSWASMDPAAAERWALANHTGDGPNPHLNSIIRGIAAVDLAHASRIAESMPFGRERSDAVDAITRALFVEGAEAAMAYPSSIQDPQLRAGFVAAIADRLARREPEKAASWLLSNNDPESQVRAARSVAAALARENSQTAAAIVPKLSPEARAEAARGIIPIMSANDITGTAQWVSSLAGIPNYDRVVEEFVWSCDHRAPEQSAAWIQGIADPERQTRLYHRMLGEWANRDAAAVRSWVASNQVPESVARRFNR